MALLIVLLITLAVSGVSLSFIGFMNQQQARAGIRHRVTAALSLAEAGVYRAAAVLEASAPDGSPGRNWRPTHHSEEVSVGPLRGRFSLTLTDDADGAMLVTSVGELSGHKRALRVRIRLASPALLAALYGRSYIRLDGPPAATVIIPYSAVAARPWAHIAAGRGIWFANTAVALNKPGVSTPIGPGPTDSPFGEDGAPQPAPVRFVLSRDADVLVDRDQQIVGIQQLRAIGMNVEREELRAEAFPEPPGVEEAVYRAKAIINAANADLNKIVGDALRDPGLAQKRDSLYTPEQFDELQQFTQATDRLFQLEGMVYVTGRVRLRDSWGLKIVDGTLVTEGVTILGERSWLEITHSRPTRSLPGLIVRNRGGLFIGPEARLRVHGLVYVDWLFQVAGGAQVDIVGSVLGADRTLSFWNTGGSVVIRYDPAVLGTPGLYVPTNHPVVAWIEDWQELP